MYDARVETQQQNYKQQQVSMCPLLRRKLWEWVVRHTCIFDHCILQARQMKNLHS